MQFFCLSIKQKFCEKNDLSFSCSRNCVPEPNYFWDVNIWGVSYRIVYALDLIFKDHLFFSTESFQVLSKNYSSKSHLSDK